MIHPPPEKLPLIRDLWPSCFPKVPRHHKCQQPTVGRTPPRSGRKSSRQTLNQNRLTSHVQIQRSGYEDAMPSAKPNRSGVTFSRAEQNLTVHTEASSNLRTPTLVRSSSHSSRRMATLGGRKK